MSLSRPARKLLRELLDDAYSNAVDDLMPEDMRRFQAMATHLDEIAQRHGMRARYARMARSYEE